MYRVITLTINGKRQKIKAKICNSLFSRIKGLMFCSKNNAKSLLFVFSREQQINLHMFFVFFPIYVIWFNKNMKKVAIQKLKPFQFSKTYKAKYVLEIPIIKK
ncbi:DUF192 domain-containing protein [Candidatus Pacearchaeota archaeon]|nr:DUF192 domain-containing protein [Candidatus Pacearchaeota archaeon]